MRAKCYAHKSIAELTQIDADVVNTRVEHGAHNKLAPSLGATPDVLTSRPVRRKATDTTEYVVGATRGPADRLERGALRSHCNDHGASGTHMYIATTNDCRLAKPRRGPV